MPKDAREVDFEKHNIYLTPGIPLPEGQFISLVINGRLLNNSYGRSMLIESIESIDAYMGANNVQNQIEAPAEDLELLHKEIQGLIEERESLKRKLEWHKGEVKRLQNKPNINKGEVKRLQNKPNINTNK